MLREDQEIYDTDDSVEINAGLDLHHGRSGAGQLIMFVGLDHLSHVRRKAKLLSGFLRLLLLKPFSVVILSPGFR